MRRNEMMAKDSAIYTAPAMETIFYTVEGILCDSDGSEGGIDPWRFNDNPMTF